MATRALTAVAPSASRQDVSVKSPGCAGDWQPALLNEDAEQIWQALQHLVKTETSTHDPSSALVQELFLSLLANDRFQVYIDQGYSDEQIRLDVLAHLNG